MADRNLRVLDTYGRTQLSLDLWQLTRSMFDEFVEAKCGTYDFKDNSRFAPDLWRSPVIVEIFTGLILVDVHDREIWLNGCLSGYDGLGFQGTRQILETERFSEAHVDIAHDYGEFHVRKDRDEPLHVAQKRH